MKAMLSIAGSDSIGGAGIQADLKTAAAHHVHGMTAITAVTAQNTLGVKDVQDMPASLVAGQIDAVFEDIVPDAVKVGMVPSMEIARIIAESLKRHDAHHIVVDPVMVATSGSSLTTEGVPAVLLEELFPLAQVVTPNIPEAEVLSGTVIASEGDMENAAGVIAQRVSAICKEPGMGSVPAILIKGGHACLSGGAANDLLRTPDGKIVWLYGSRVNVERGAHGTGCTLSSSIACHLAAGCDLESAVRKAKHYVKMALCSRMTDVGRGTSLLEHMWKYEDSSEFE